MSNPESEANSKQIPRDTLSGSGKIGLVLSGGGTRAAYQVGALKALARYLELSRDPVSVLIGSSIGAVNTILLGACIKTGLSNAIGELEALWRERTFQNTFSGSPSRTFFRAIKMAILQYAAPGPNATNYAIFDPTPLMETIDRTLNDYGGLSIENRDPNLENVAVMTTVEGSQRKPLLFLSAREKLSEEVLRGASFEVYYTPTLTAKHGLGSAALPSVMPPVELDVENAKVRVVDGGISQNVPVDPAVRLGAERVIVIDISGRDWWLRRFGEPQYKRPDWEVPADLQTFCMRPPSTFTVRCQKPLGPLLKEAVHSSTMNFIKALGPTWPVYTLLKRKLGDEVAYEVMTYIALHPDYVEALIERGYNETIAILKQRKRINFEQIPASPEVSASV